LKEARPRARGFENSARDVRAHVVVDDDMILAASEGWKATRRFSYELVSVL
jgi:hypothetical protein